MTVSKHRLSVIVLSLLFVVLTSAVSAQDEDFHLTLPEPTDTPVGYRLYTAVDEAREEIFTEETDDVRTFPLAIYYPAAPDEDAVPAPYSTEAENEAYNTALMLPPVVFESMTGHLYVDAPLAPSETGYPVLLFSPGFGTPIRLYSALLTEVASQGFIVAVVDHPYSQSVSVFPDDSVITANDAGMNTGGDVVLNVWIEDTQYALDTLTELNETDEVLAGAFDLERVGAFGHSYGGATAANVTLVDERVLAALNMDGTVFGDAGQGVVKPMMIIAAPLVEFTDEELAAVGMTRDAVDAGIAEYNDSISGALSTSEAPYHIAIAGTLHGTFAIDVALLRKLLPDVIIPELIGTIEGTRANEIMAAYTVAFFETYLLDEPSVLLDGPSADYPEVEFLPIES